MRYLKTMIPVLIALVFLITPIAGAAEEEVVYNFVGTKSYDVWVHSDGRMQSAPYDNDYGKAMHEMVDTIAIPENVLEKYEITRVEFTSLNQASQQEYNNFGTYYGWDHERYSGYFFEYANDERYKINISKSGLSADKTAINTVHSGRIAENLNILQLVTLDIMDRDNREKYNIQPYDFNPAGLTYGGRYFSCWGVKVYGIPKGEKPDLSVKIDHSGLPKNTKGGETYTSKVTYSLSDSVDYEVTARLGLEHNGYPITSVNGKQITLQPGESKTFDFTFTGVEGKNSILLARVWPHAPTTEDSDWSNNRDEVEIPTEVKNDLAADLDYREVTVLPGKTVTLRGTIINNGNTDQSTNYIWRIGGKTYGPTNITVPAGGKKNVSITYTAPSYPTALEYYLEVNPNRNRPNNESTWSNNRTDANDIEVLDIPSSGGGGGGRGPILVD